MTRTDLFLAAAIGASARIDQPTVRLGLIADVTEAIADAIRSAGADGLISGHIFAAVCGKVSYSDYTGIIHMLKDIGLVSESGFVLRWIGGAQ